MSKRRRRRALLRGQLCVYCGDNPATTWDDIPPKCFYTKPRGRLLLIPSCVECNEGSSKNDEYFRNSVVFRADVAEHPIAWELNQTALRGLARPEKQGMRAALLRALKVQPVYTPAGLYLGRAPTFEVSGEPLYRVGVRLTKALFWYHSCPESPSKRTRLPDDYEVSAWMWDNLDEESKGVLDPARRSLLQRPANYLGRGEVFRYHFQHFPDEDPNVSVWLMGFYGQVGILAMTTPRQWEELRELVRQD